jgi:hypothetical protein
MSEAPVDVAPETRRLGNLRPAHLRTEEATAMLVEGLECLPLCFWFLLPVSVSYITF